MDLGQSRRGVDMGPGAVRYARLQHRLEGLGYRVQDAGNLAVPQVEELGQPGAALPGGGRAHHLPQVAAVCQTIYERVQAFPPADRAIFIGGDHSISIGTVAAVAQRQRVGVIWVDAHADINTPHTSPSGNIHGMSVAALLGAGPAALVNIGGDGATLQPAQLAMVATRDLDGAEKARLAQGDIAVYTMRTIDEDGIGTIARRLLAGFREVDALHVSLDLDALEPSIAPGVGTPVIGGLSYREAHLLMEILADSGKVRTLDLVEVNPILDRHNSTAAMAVDLAASLFGQQILP
ncbi:MAG: arginase [Anaerolineae bacterium]|nr:arginase [Anaerolineae bacterium]